MSKDESSKNMTSMLFVYNEGDFFGTVKRTSERFGSLLEKMLKHIQKLDVNDYELNFKKNLTTDEKVEKIKSDCVKIVGALHCVQVQTENLQDYVAEYFDKVVRHYDGKGFLGK